MPGVRYALLTKRKTSGACSQPSTGWSGMSRSLLMTGGSSMSAAGRDRQRKGRDEAGLPPCQVKSSQVKSLRLQRTGKNHLYGMTIEYAT